MHQRNFRAINYWRIRLSIGSLHWITVCRHQNEKFSSPLAKRPNFMLFYSWRNDVFKIETVVKTLHHHHDSLFLFIGPNSARINRIIPYAHEYDKKYQNKSTNHNPFGHKIQKNYYCTHVGSIKTASRQNRQKCTRITIIVSFALFR